MEDKERESFQVCIEKGSINKKQFDSIIAAFKKNKKEGEETLSKFIKKSKKGRPGATAIDISKEELDVILESTLSTLFISESQYYKLK